MCGIVGYIGQRKAFPILIGGLKRLEYRGYDSAGVALVDGDSINVVRQTGKVSALEDKVMMQPELAERCTMGIAHTRWATHGAPSVENAHPHTSMSGQIAIVHNGIIENYQHLKSQLEANGYKFASSTDTEVLVQLIDYYYFKLLKAKSVDKRQLLKNATRLALDSVFGAYAIAVIERGNPSHIVVARKSSPLVVGIGKDNSEFFIASDATPIVEYTKQMVYLDDETIADLYIGEEIHASTLDNKKVEAEVTTVDIDINKLSKGGFDHFMLKEIHEQPDCIRDCLRGRIVTEADGRKSISLSAIRDYGDILAETHHITIVACGTSWHAGLIGRQLIEQMCRKRVSVEYASEFRYTNPIVEKGDVVIAVSQSGETADTLAAIELAKKNGALVFGIVNAVGSSIARAAETGIYIHVGPEIGVASTKAFTGQVVVFTMLALALGHKLGTIDDAEYYKTVAELDTIPDKMTEALEIAPAIDLMSRQFTYAHNFIYLGRGFNYPVALEGALKIKEISYIHAEGYPAAEMKHGPIALVDNDMPIVFVATDDSLHHKVVSNMQEVKSRGGRIFAVAHKDDDQIRAIANETMEVPTTLPALQPCLSVIPLQLLAYYVAIRKGLDVDMPRNLAKSVTVE